jgi:DNA polymerase III epsilon subunit-like protein
MPDCIFVDTETTGLDDVENDVIDIWVERRDYATLALKAAVGGHVSVTRRQVELMSVRHDPNKPSALEVNHYTDEAWVDAEPWPVRCEEFGKLLVPGETILWIGSNPWFDVDMIRAMNWKYGTRMPRVRLIVRNTAEMAEPLKKAGVVKACSLSVLAEYYGLPEQSHTARGDVETCVEVYRRLRGCDV